MSGLSNELSSWLQEQNAARTSANLQRSRSVTTPLGAAQLERDACRCLDFASNDYLGLARDPRVIAAACEAARQGGVGSGSSALISGRTSWHAELEAELARFEGEEAALLFPSGYAAVVGTVSALVGPDDAVFCERLNHACLVDGCRLSRARLRVYRSEALATLERRLAAAMNAPRRWIVTDGVFGMDGILAPLPALCDLAERHDAYLIVDEAHGTGVLGKNGRGACEAAGVSNRRIVRVGTLSKALGAAGGFVVGPRELVDYLWNMARTQMFSTALPIPVAAAALRAVQLVSAEPERRERVQSLSQTLHRQLAAAGIRALGVAGVPIIAVPLETPRQAIAVGAGLARQGFAVGTIRPPTVPRGGSRLRISLSALHTSEQLERLVQALRSANLQQPLESELAPFRESQANQESM